MIRSRGTRIAAFALAAIAAMTTFAAGCASKKTEPLPGAGENANAPATETAAPLESASLPEAANSPSAPAAPALIPVDARVIAMQEPTYPFATCVVCDSSLTIVGPPRDVLRDGRLVRFCGDDCAAKFDANPSSFFPKIDASIVKAQLPAYPLDVCVIEGGKLGARGEPIRLVCGTRLVQLCSKECEPEFAKDPAAALAKIDAALIAAQRPSYNSRECPLMEGMALDAMGEPFDFLYGTRLVRLCCEKCVDKFWQNPEAAIAKLDALSGAKTEAGT